MMNFELGDIVAISFVIAMFAYIIAGIIRHNTGSKFRIIEKNNGYFYIQAKLSVFDWCTVEPYKEGVLSTTCRYSSSKKSIFNSYDAAHGAILGHYIAKEKLEKERNKKQYSNKIRKVYSLNGSVDGHVKDDLLHRIFQACKAKDDVEIDLLLTEYEKRDY